MKILIGVTSGISLYKMLNIVRFLTKTGHSVKVMMTENAAKLINPLLFQTLSGNEVYTRDFDPMEPLAHIRLGDWADVMAVVPATANTLAKIAGGIADNLLTSTILACDKRKVLFPAMNVKMLENPATQENLNKLRNRGFEIIDPAFGDLACGYQGRGRLPADDTIIGILTRHPDQLLKGKKFIVTAGGTIEQIDPVRSITNASSGKMGVEIAKALFRQGAEVLLIHGSVSTALPGYIPAIKTQSTDDMLSALKTNLASYDGLYMAAAPADFKVKNVSGQKIKKTGSTITLELIENPDILKELSTQFSGKLFVGFALESGDYEKNARKKLAEKKLDFIVLNRISESFTPLGNDSNSVVLYSKDGPEEELSSRSKSEVANWLVDKTLGLS